MEQITLKNSILVVKKTAWFCSRQCPKQNEIIQKKKEVKDTRKIVYLNSGAPSRRRVTHAVTHLSSDGGVT